MRRRSVLSGLVLAGLGGAAFSLTRSEESEPSDGSGDGDGNGDGEIRLAELGYPATICETDPMDEPGIYAIDDPEFAPDWSGVEIDDRYGDLEADTVVFGIERDGEARGYPVPVVWYHEAVNDVFGDPLLVTYCPICHSAMVARRRIDGEPATFEVTGELWQPPEMQTRGAEAANRTFGATRTEAEGVEVRNSGNLVLVDDATGSYWSQILAQAICGPMEGERLDPVPVKALSWAEWQERYPDGEVLLPPPHSGTV